MVIGILVAVIFIVGFIALLVFVPADKLLKNTNPSNSCCNNTSGDDSIHEISTVYDKLAKSKYSYFPGNPANPNRHD